MFLSRLLRVCLVFLLCISTAFSYAVDEKAQFTAYVSAHQKMILLLSAAQSQDPLAQYVQAAREHYVLKHELYDDWMALAQQQTLNTAKRQLLPITVSFVSFYQGGQLHKADRLAFADLAEELMLLEQERQTPEQGLQALREIALDIQQSTDYFGKQFSRAMGQLTKTRGAEADWQAYISHLNTLHSLPALFDATTRVPVLYREKTRGKNLVKDKKDKLSAAAPKVVWGNGLPDKTVVLTFDDGPHRLRTAKILDTLKEYKVNAYFFAVGQNLGKVTTDSQGQEVITLHKRNRKVIDRILDEGHVLANHSFSHSVLTKLEKPAQQKELSATNKLIKKASAFDNTLFRPPYGSKNADLEVLINEQSMASIMWNVDSLDWSDPIPESIAQRTLEILEKKKKGILLFHDIHKQTVAALPLILQGLAKAGYKVTTIDGKPFNLVDSGIPKLPKAKKPKLYANSWAVVIGINQYQHWPKLDYAVPDAKSIAGTLHKNFGFAKERIIEIYDEQATRERIVEVLAHTMADPKVIGKEDRVFIFYAGHGATRGLANGRNLGYLIPADADMKKFTVQGISMSQLNDFSSLIPAKHVYFVMDSCYSGLALTRAGGGQAYNYLSHITGRQARQIITAGGADQEVADGGPNGHSVFTWALLQALEGKADTDNNGYLTASEIGTYVSPVVASYAMQTPAFGNLVGSQGGDFVLELNPANVKRFKTQQAQVKAQQVAALTQAQDDLQSELDRQFDLDKKAPVSVKAAAKGDKTLKNNQRVRAAYALDAQALKLYKKGQLEQAEMKWAQAVKLNPFNENIVNNYGFVLDKLGRNEEALIWYYRTVELNPQRTPIYLNLGDMMLKLDKANLAISYYERYLHLYPSYKKAPQLKAKIEKLRKL